jgi:hypothetical protein
LQNRAGRLELASAALTVEKATKHGKMTTHGHVAEVSRRQCFCHGVFTRPRPIPDIDGMRSPQTNADGSIPDFRFVAAVRDDAPISEVRQTARSTK